MKDTTNKPNFSDGEYNPAHHGCFNGRHLPPKQADADEADADDDSEQDEV